MNNVITLTTDFGTKDLYVAAMKGVILSINPGAKIVDLSHEISPQNLMETNLFIAGACPYFPVGTIHVVVVDPGVGTERAPLAVNAGNQYYIVPDNGILTLLTEDIDIDEARVVENHKIMFKNISKTFHGRDIFAPASAHLSMGFKFEDIGKKIHKIKKLNIPKLDIRSDTLIGEIIHIDRFGNLITNIKKNFLNNSKNIEIKIKNLQFNRINHTYNDVAQGKALSLIGSSGLLEISVNQGNASEVLSAKIGEKVIIKVK